MGNDLKTIHLIQRLTERLNSEVFEMSYTLIANYLLRNHKTINNITIDDICNEAFVSKSTVRRFCNNIGYKNFTELKDAYLKINLDNENSYFDFKEDIPQIINSVFQIDTKIIHNIIKEIKTNNYIFILFPYHFYAPLYDFQRQMIFKGKMINLMPNIDLHFEDTKDYLNNAVLIIVDFDNTYAHTLIPYLNQLNTVNVVLTNQNNHCLLSNFNIEFENLKSSTLQKYQLSFLMDRIIREYENV